MTIDLQLAVQPDFFRTLEIPLVRGRMFSDGDTRGAPPVAVVNQAFARLCLSGGNPIGRRFGSHQGSGEIEIVGVVGDTQYDSLREPGRQQPIFYRPSLQDSSGLRAWTFEARTVGDPAAMVPAIRKAAHEVDPRMPLLDITTEGTLVADYWSVERMFASVSVLFGGLALAVSAVGLFGLMSFLVARRTREIGIRMALGADRRDILRWVMREAMILFAGGAVIGLGASLTATRLLRSVLFGLTPTDPVTIAAAVATLLLAATLAGYVPARRATRVDPQVALRLE